MNRERDLPAQRKKKPTKKKIKKKNNSQNEQKISKFFLDSRQTVKLFDDFQKINIFIDTFQSRNTKSTDDAEDLKWELYSSLRWARVLDYFPDDLIKSDMLYRLI